MVSNASEDLPEPDRPVKTIKASRGMLRFTFFRLCSRAPWTTIRSGSCSPAVALACSRWDTRLLECCWLDAPSTLCVVVKYVIPRVLNDSRKLDFQDRTLLGLTRIVAVVEVRLFAQS